jgi:hypothetical protein
LVTLAELPGPEKPDVPAALSVHCPAVAAPPTTVLCSVKRVQVTVLVMRNSFAPDANVRFPMSPVALLVQPAGTVTDSPMVTVWPSS